MYAEQVLSGPETLASLGLIDGSIVTPVRQAKGRFLNVGGEMDVVEFWVRLNESDGRDLCFQGIDDAGAFVSFATFSAAGQ